MLLAASPAFASADSARFNRLLESGDAAYRQKQRYASFLQSLRFFDSAQVLAEQSRDPDMLAQATFARGRVYDAWNKEPSRTVELFTKATALFRQSGNLRRYFYAKHLVAHAYDKVQDSANATRILRELITELQATDTAFRRSLKFIPEMALIATEVRAYGLADSILKQLTRRAWIANDPETYNYLDHYYLTRSRLDLYWLKNRQSTFPDSLAVACLNVQTVFDRIYYAHQLAKLYAVAGNYEQAYRFQNMQQELQSGLTAGSDFEQLQRALVESETASERRQLVYEKTISKARSYVNWALSLLAMVIGGFSIYQYRRNKAYRQQSVHLQDVNAELDKQISTVELLNKEIQHRIKNNLYTIYSLLHMQEESTDNEEVIAHLEAARMRVESVAALHDHLSGHSDSVDFGAYIKVLVNKVVACQSHRRNVITHISAEPVSLPLNTCFALSLILNEWITNSIKYAQPPNELLNIEVQIITTVHDVCIDFRDDGVIKSAEHMKEGLGSEIIRLLTAQVKGRLQASRHHPYHYNLCIPHGR